MKNVLIDYHLFGASGGNMATSLTSTPVNISYQDNIGINVEWAGTAPVGVLTIEVSNDYKPNTGAGNFETLNLGTMSISGATGSLLISCNQVPFIFMRAVYTRTSGTGTLTAVMALKDI